RLMELIGMYGILEIAGMLRKGAGRDEIGKTLREKCGIQSVQDILVSHFGNRTFLIKTQYIFNNIRSTARNIRKSGKAGRRLLYICEQIIENIDDLMSSVQTLKELKALQMYYNGQLRFNDEEEL